MSVGILQPLLPFEVTIKTSAIGLHIFMLHELTKTSLERATNHADVKRRASSETGKPVARI
jgi:hypothetical protein